MGAAFVSFHSAINVCYASVNGGVVCVGVTVGRYGVVLLSDACGWCAAASGGGDIVTDRACILACSGVELAIRAHWCDVELTLGLWCEARNVCDEGAEPSH